MESTRIDELAAQVVAWHNRNRLAQRITTDHVRAVGVVVLPFALPPGAPDAGLAQRLDPPLLDDSVHEPIEPQPDEVSEEPAAAEPAASAPAKPAAALIARLRDFGAGLLHRLPRRRATGLKAAFSDDFIAPLSPQRVARFALKQGSGERPGTASWPQRVVPVDEDRKALDLSVLYLRTACIELGEHRCRVLIGRGTKPRIIGPRAWSVPRVASAAAGATLLAGVATVGLLGGWFPLGDLPGSGEPSVLASLEPAASASKPVASAGEQEPDHALASTEAAASAASSAASPSAASAPQPGESPEAADAAAAAASTPLPEAEIEPESTPPRSTVWREAAQASNEPPRRRPELRPELSDEMREAALREGERLRALPPPTGKPARATGSMHVYAVMTAVTSTRTASEQRHQVMGSSAATGELPGKPRSELMKVGEGWRAVLWPFASRDEADIARAMLAERGVRTEVLEF